MNLTWTAATDNVGVTNYLVERCAGAGCTSFAQIGTSADDLFQRHAAERRRPPIAIASRATDAASNLGPYSNIATATTPAAPDTQDPRRRPGQRDRDVGDDDRFELDGVDGQRRRD